jgi:hypothetical protein
VQRRASNSGVIMVVRQKIAFGRTHAHHELTVHVAEHTITVELDCATVTPKPTADGQRVCQRSWYPRWKRISLSSSARHLTPTCSWGPKGVRPARSSFHPIWGKARQEAGVPELHLHDLRHTGNTPAAETGANAARTDGAHGTPLDPRRFDLPTRPRPPRSSDRGRLGHDRRNGRHPWPTDRE